MTKPSDRPGTGLSATHRFSARDPNATDNRLKEFSVSDLAPVLAPILATLMGVVPTTPVTVPVNAPLLSFGAASTGKAVSSVNPNIGSQSFIVDVTFSTPSSFTAETHIFGVWGDNFYGQNQWFVSILPTGKPQLAWTDGTNFTILQPTLALPAASTVHLRISANTAAGSAEFFVIDGSGAANSLGIASGGAARSVRFDAANGRVQIGQSTDTTKQYTGNFYAASLKVGGTLVLNPVVSSGAITDSTGATWALTQADAFLVDLLTTPIAPTRAVPVNTSAVPVYGTLASGAANIMSLDFRPSAATVDKVRDRATLDTLRFNQMITGNLTSATGDPTDNPTAGASYARIGNYPPDSPANNLIFTDQGLKFGVSGINNNKGKNGDNKYDIGELRAGFMRLEPDFAPGCYMEFGIIGTKSMHGWMPMPWLYRGRQSSWKRAGVNGPYDSVTNQFVSNAGLIDFHEESYQEIDILDAFFKGDLADLGRWLTSGVVVKDIDSRQVKAYAKLFLANSLGFTNDGYHAKAPTPWSNGVHVLGFNWRTDNILEYIWDGVVFMREYWEFWSHNKIDPFTGANRPVGMHLLFGGQCGATFNSSGPILIPNLDDVSSTLCWARVWDKNASGFTVPSNGITPPAGY